MAEKHRRHHTAEDKDDDAPPQGRVGPTIHDAPEAEAQGTRYEDSDDPLRFLEDATNVVLIGPPGVGKTMLAVALGRAALEAGYRTCYTTAAELVARCHRAALEGRWASLDLLLRSARSEGLEPPTF